MLKEKLDDNDFALVDVLEDPIFMAEFLRSTRDGSVNKQLWPSKEFEYRHYQRQLISDQTDKIVLVGGRAIGKCQPVQSKIYTVDGYEKIYYLRKKGQAVLEVYCQDEKGNYTTRRAVLQKDQWTKTYRVTTQSGYTILGTANHPILTPDGYILIADLNVGDTISVSTHLPWLSTRNILQWHELRMMGYIMFNENWRLEKEITPKRKAVKDEMRKIAEIGGLRFADMGNGNVQMLRKKEGGVGMITQLARELEFDNARKFMGIMEDYPRFIPDAIMSERLENNKVFIEAVYAQFGELSRKSVTLDCVHQYAADDMQELLLRFGIETYIEDRIISLRDERAIYRFYTTFTIPGVSVENLTMPPASFDPSPHWRYDPIVDIQLHKEKEITYALYVYQHHNYISSHMHVHNSLVLEDKHIYDMINQDLQFPETKEMLLTTNNQAQLEPIQGRLITRFTTSPLLKGFLHSINRSSGVFEFRFGDLQYLLRTRIAGSTGAQNLIGLHIPQINIDESQLFTMQAWNQLSPALNTWEQRTQVFIAGVPNGLRNSLLYTTDRKFSTWKKYRIPSHNNPYYDQETDLDNIKKYGGEDTDDYKQLVLGQHGQASFTVITRDQITQKTYPFFTYRYTGADIAKGTVFEDVLERPDLKDYVAITAGIDCGYVDPTVISVVARDKAGIWHSVIRYVLTRIDMATQEKILAWLDSQYHFDVAGIDIGSGGGGTQLLHSLLYRPEYINRQFESRLIPVQFGERVAVGFNSDGKELTQTTKTLGATLLVQQLQQSTLILSEIDHAAISELERITKMKGTSGDDRYFILSEKGNGASPNDHLFASMICWAIATRDMSFQKPRRKRLGKSNGGY